MRPAAEAALKIFFDSVWPFGWEERGYWGEVEGITAKDMFGRGT
jgi:hypothetical protein